MMNMKNSTVLAKAEFGSRYKGLNDKYSDEDSFYVVAQGLDESIFGNLKDGVYHAKDNDYRVYSLERFVDLSLKGSYDGFLLFSSFLEQNRDNDLNQQVFKDFYEDDTLFDALVRSKERVFASSVLGMSSQSKLKMEKLGREDEFGKNVVNLAYLTNVLYHFLTHVKDDDYVFDWLNVVGLGENQNVPFDVSVLLEHKRCSKDEWLNNSFLKEKCDELLAFHEECRELYNKTELKNQPFSYVNTLKQNVTDYLVQVYVKKYYENM